MILKALAVYKPSLTAGKVDYEVTPFINPLMPACSKAHVVIDEEVMFSTTLAKTVQIIDVEVTFGCMRCDFKTPSLKKMEKHSEAQLCRRRQ